jgi:hypothetical protein
MDRQNSRARTEPTSPGARPSALAEPIEIASFWRNRRGEAVVVQLREYEGRALVDVRVNFSAPDGHLRPTPKGLSIVVARLPQLAAALVKAEKKARELGLLDGEDGA